MNTRWSRTLADSLPADWEGSLITQCIGLTLGETFAGQAGSASRREYTVMGDDVNLAARLMAAAQVDQILCSGPIQRAVENEFSFTALPTIRVKGKTDAISIAQLDGPRGGEIDRRLGMRGPLIGREAEWETLLACLSGALEGIRQICAEIGQPMTDVAIAWLFQQPGVSTVIAGARTPEQIRQTAGAVALDLAPEIVARLAEATEAVKSAIGPNPDMWQSESRFR